MENINNTLVRIKPTALATGLLLGLLPTFTHAAIDTDIFGGPSGFNIARSDDFGDSSPVIIQTIANEVLRWLLYLSTAAAIIMIIYAGIQLIQSGGDSEKAQAAKRAIIYIVIGIVVVTCAILIINLSGGLAKFLAGEASTF